MWNVQRIVKKGDYLYAVVPEHPRATKHGYVLAHRIVMENQLGRLLDAKEVVHHKNGNKHDNREENLEVKQNSEHAREHALLQGRLRVVLRCPSCGAMFERWKSYTQKGQEFFACSKSCGTKFSWRVRREGRTHEVEAAISGNIVREYRYFHDNPEETPTRGSVETIRSPPEKAKR